MFDVINKKGNTNKKNIKWKLIKWKEYKMEAYIYIYIADSLLCTAETNATL